VSMEMQTAANIPPTSLPPSVQEDRERLLWVPECC
jgi:hypothetical protein